MSNFNLALRNQVRAVNALFMREVQTRYGKYKIGFLWAIFEAIAHVAVFAMIKTFLGVQGPDGINVILFLISGIVPYFYFRNVITRMMNALESNKSLLSITKISFLDFFYARYLLESFLILICLPVVMAIGIFVISNMDKFYFTGYEVNDILQILFALFYLGILGFGFGLIASSARVFFPMAQMVINVILRVAYLTSGILFPIERVPYRFHDILYYNPIVHCMEYLRSGFFFDYIPNEHLMDSSYLAILSLVTVFFGLILINRSKGWVLR